MCMQIMKFNDLSPKESEAPKSDIYQSVYLCIAEVPKYDIKIICPQSQGKKLYWTKDVFIIWRLPVIYSTCQHLSKPFRKWCPLRGGVEICAPIEDISKYVCTHRLAYAFSVIAVSYKFN